MLILLSWSILIFYVAYCLNGFTDIFYNNDKNVGSDVNIINNCNNANNDNTHNNDTNDNHDNIENSGNSDNK